jgi:hypothetical protein
MVFPWLLAAGAGGIAGLATKGGREALFGKGESFQQKSRLDKQQQPLYQQLLASSQGPGGGGAFGQSADYYRDLLSNDSQTNQMMAAPELRRFNEQIIPGLAEQFAGMGSGGLSSSGFRNAAVSAGTDLAERLGAIRAQLRSQGAAGLSGIGQQGLGDYTQNIHRPATSGLLGGFAQGAGQGLGKAAGTYFMGG